MKCLHIVANSVSVQAIRLWGWAQGSVTEDTSGSCRRPGCNPAFTWWLPPICNFSFRDQMPCGHPHVSGADKEVDTCPYISQWRLKLNNEMTWLILYNFTRISFSDDHFQHSILPRVIVGSFKKETFLWPCAVFTVTPLSALHLQLAYITCPLLCRGFETLPFPLYLSS